MKLKRITLLPLLLIASLCADAQLNVKDQPVKIWFLQPQLGVQFPMGDMKDRFYTNTAIGFGLSLKTSGNWLMGIDWNYLFAEKVRNEDQILSNITTSEGYVIDQTGVFANIYFRERGFTASLKGGKLWNVGWGNPNSGVVLMGSLGALQHRIRIENYENTAPQLQDEYIKGYDKLRLGPAASLYLGYLRFSNHKLTNFALGIEYLYAPTRSMRDYDFVLMAKDESIRSDQLITIRFSWAIPVYNRAPREFYYN